MSRRSLRSRCEFLVDLLALTMMMAIIAWVLVKVFWDVTV